MKPASHPFFNSSLNIFLGCLDKGDVDGASFCLAASASFCDEEEKRELEVIARLFHHYQKLQRENEELLAVSKDLISYSQDLTNSCWQTMLELQAVKRNYAIAMQQLQAIEQPQEQDSLKNKCKKIDSLSGDKK